MKVALTGATGFIGQYIIKELVQQNHVVRAWYRNSAAITNLVNLPNVSFINGELGNFQQARELLVDQDVLIHAAVYRTSQSFQGTESDFSEYLSINLMGSLELFRLAKDFSLKKVIFVSTCAVHDKILPDRPLDETHPAWPASHYGAYKAAVEAFVHSFAAQGLDICAIRPTGVYGLHHNPDSSKWYELIRAVAKGENVSVARGGKEVHAGDVARAIALLITTENTKGEIYNCYDQYISEFDVAHLTKKLTGSASKISGNQTRPKNEIETTKIKALGFDFGGDERLTSSIQEILEQLTQRNP